MKRTFDERNFQNSSTDQKVHEDTTHRLITGNELDQTRGCVVSGSCSESDSLDQAQGQDHECCKRNVAKHAKTNISQPWTQPSEPRPPKFPSSSLLNSTIRVLPLENYNDPFPNFRQPMEIGSFSQDFQGKFVHDRSKLKYFIASQEHDPRFNLRNGYRQFIQKKDTHKHHLDDLLRWTQLNKRKFEVSTNKPPKQQPSTSSSDESQISDSLHTDFVSWRGALTKLLCSPYEHREGWKFAVTLHNGTLYLCEFDTEQRIKQKATENDRQKEMSYWGFKFEQYVTTADPESSPDVTQAVNNHEAFCSVVRTRLANHSLVFGGEVDCCDPKDKTKYIELKTSREIDNYRQDRNFKRYKLLKWWAQSFLVGIGKIVGGFRDDDGVVHRLQEFKTMDIPKLCKEEECLWEPSVCFNFLNILLQHFKDVAVEDDPRIAYVFSCTPGSEIQCEKWAAGSEYSFLPPWYYASQRADP